MGNSRSRHLCGLSLERYQIYPQNKNFEDWKHSTSFANFYGSMIKLKFFGKWYNVVAPLLILVIGLMFSVMGVFKYNSKTVEGIMLYN